MEMNDLGGLSRGAVTITIQVGIPDCKSEKLYCYEIGIRAIHELWSSSCCDWVGGKDAKKGSHCFGVAGRRLVLRTAWRGPRVGIQDGGILYLDSRMV